MDGPRRPLDREKRARFRFLINAYRRARRLTPLGELVGAALCKRLGESGQCDPAHDTIADDVGCSARTVRRALAALKGLGLVFWQCRLVRNGWRVAQTSNAYWLVPAADILAVKPVIDLKKEREPAQDKNEEPEPGSDAWGRRNAARQIALLSDIPWHRHG